MVAQRLTLRVRVPADSRTVRPGRAGRVNGRHRQMSSSPCDQRRQMWCAIATGPGSETCVGSSGPLAARSTIARISARENQRASANLLRIDRDLLGQRLAHEPGHQASTETARADTPDTCTRPTLIPASSKVSRRTASSNVSPGSMKPAKHENRLPARRWLRPKSPYSPRTDSMITTGSVRGKCDARHSGQRRTQPANSTRVGEPHCAQKRCRACQSISERASARIAASPPGKQRRQRARVERLAVRRRVRYRRRVASTAKRGPSSPRPRKISVAPRSITSRHGATFCQSSAGAPRPVPGQRPQVAQRQNARRRIVEQRAHPRRIAPPLAGAVERIAGKAINLFHAADANHRAPPAQSPPGDSPCAARSPFSRSGGYGPSGNKSGSRIQDAEIASRSSSPDQPLASIDARQLLSCPNVRPVVVLHAGDAGSRMATRRTGICRRPQIARVPIFPVPSRSR